MTTRRTFVKSLVAVPSLLAAGLSSASVKDASRLALVIGNSAYRQSPLANPANDARAMSELLGTAGFSVDTRLDARFDDIVSAIEQFGEDLRRSESRLALFYYAGHGVQLDWRNYLLPVDAVVTSEDQVRQRCVDLGFLLDKLEAAKGTTFVVILDACRNNPFGSAFRPAQKGLSQFDAPVGSLLAYATSPGNVASDGAGSNGLYTENLIRELSQRGSSIEDCLKRVRLNVRLQSQGAQLPWETTSLERDVYLFENGLGQLSDAELQKRVEDDLAEWGRIRNSRDPGDWVAYLRRFPNGSFAEIAQARLARLLADFEAAGVESKVDSKTALSPPAPIKSVQGVSDLPVLEFKPDSQLPVLAVVTANPFSAGRYPLGRRFSVGDKATFRTRDLLTGVEMNTTNITISSVDVEADRVEGNLGEWVYDLMGNELRNPVLGQRNMPAQLVPYELQVGKKWSAGWMQQHPKLGEQALTMKLHIAAFEDVRTELGAFKAFRIDGRGWLRDRRGNIELKRRFWIVPGINFFIRTEIINRNNRASGNLLRTELVDLVYLRQHHRDAACGAAAEGGWRSLLIGAGCS